MMDAPEQQPDTSVVRGTVLVYNTWARILFDTGASHSFIALTFARALGLPVDQLAQPLCVETPVGGVVTLGNICRACDLMVAGNYLTFDLILLDMHTFDVILGMDWLGTFRASIDCYARRVTLHVPSGTLCTFVGEREDPIIPLRLLLQGQVPLGCLLSSLLGSVDVEATFELPPVVCDFSDVFPSDLYGLPPCRAIEFCIDLIPGTAPISVAPYRMASAELKELKIQLQELSDKGFI